LISDSILKAKHVQLALMVWLSGIDMFNLLYQVVVRTDGPTTKQLIKHVQLTKQHTGAYLRTVEHDVQ
jgi:hypothetical protein